MSAEETSARKEERAARARTKEAKRIYETLLNKNKAAEKKVATIAREHSRANAEAMLLEERKQELEADENIQTELGAEENDIVSLSSSFKHYLYLLWRKGTRNSARVRKNRGGRVHAKC